MTIAGGRHNETSKNMLNCVKIMLARVPFVPSCTHTQQRCVSQRRNGICDDLLYRLAGGFTSGWQSPHRLFGAFE